MEVPAPDPRPAAAPPGPGFDAAAAGKAPRRKAGRSACAVAKRRKLFVEAYLSNGHNAAQAAIAAGTGGKRPRAAGWKLLHHPEVQRMIAERAQTVAERAEMSTEAWAYELRAIAFSSIGDLFGPDGTLRAVRDLPAHVQAAIASMKVTFRSEVIKCRFYDKIAALQMVARHLGLFEPANAQLKENILVRVELVG